MRATILISACVLVLGALVPWGCGERKTVVVRDRHPVTYERDVVVERPGPVIVEERPTRVIIVRDAPPPLIVERRPGPPSRTVVWIDGYWNWDDGHRKHVWVAGHYVEPPRHGAHWEPDKWDHQRDGYRYVPGHWK